MSVKVLLNELGGEVPRWGFGYLLTTSAEGRTHVIALVPKVVEPSPGDALDGALLRFEAGGGRACRNAAVQPEVTVLFPPRPDGDGFSLLVDGLATVEGDIVEVRPSGAVLHRPAPPLGGPTGAD
jgi:hypothetical protein